MILSGSEKSMLSFVTETGFDKIPFLICQILLYIFKPKLLGT